MWQVVTSDTVQPYRVPTRSLPGPYWVNCLHLQFVVAELSCVFKVEHATSNFLFSSVCTIIIKQGSLQVIASVCEAAGGRKGAMKVLEDSTKSKSEPAIVEAASPKKEFGFEPDLYHHHQAVGFSDGDRVTTADEDLSKMFAVREAEEQLEQLLMEDELSDARIGIGAPPLPPQPQFVATLTSSTAGEAMLT